MKRLKVLVILAKLSISNAKNCRIGVYCDKTHWAKCHQLYLD